MKKAEECGHLAKEQCGSGKGHTAIAQALNKQLTMDVDLLQKTSTIFVQKMQCRVMIECHMQLLSWD